jgi:peroxiredoxin
MAALVNLALLVPLSLAPAPFAPAVAATAMGATSQELYRALAAEHSVAAALLAGSATADASARLELDRAYNARMRPLVEAGHGPALAWTLRHFVALSTDALPAAELRRELWSRLLPTHAATEWIWSREFELLETLLGDRELLGARPCAGLAATLLAAQPLAHSERRLLALTAQSEALAPLGSIDRDARRAAAAVWRAEIARGPKDELVTACERALWRLEHFVPGASFAALAGLDVDGNHVALADFRGKVVVVGFFSLEQESGRTNARALAALDRRFEGPALCVVGVSLDRSPDEFRRRADTCDLRFPTIFDGQTRALVTGGLRLDSTPLALVLDREGRLFRVCRTLTELETAHEDALRDPALHTSSSATSAGAPLR